MGLINHLDANNDERVSVAEFCALFQKEQETNLLDKKMKTLLAGHKTQLETQLHASQERGLKGHISINQFIGIMRSLSGDSTRLTA